MDALEAIKTRRSFGKLSTPAPSAIELQEMLDAAMHAPDHKELRPWKFVVLRNNARIEFGEANAQALLARQPDATEGQLEKERFKPQRAPVVIAVAALNVETKLPFVELISSAAAATQNLLLAAHASGFGAIWRTGDGVRDIKVKEWLGLAPQDELIALVYIGTALDKPTDRQSIDPAVVEWRG